MPRKTKTPTTTTTPTTTKAAKAPKTAKTQNKKVAPVEEAPPVDDVTAESLPYQHILDQMHENMATLSALTAQLTGVKKSYVALEKVVVRELKALHKSSQKKRRKAGNRAPSGFVKPTPISSQLATFLGKEKGTQMARTEVTREINAYIRKHSLQDPANGRKINPDKALKDLLKVGAHDELTYFNLQKYMSPHFQKAGAAPIS